MKRILPFALLIISSCATMEIAPTEERSIQQIHEISLSKDQIFDSSLEWMARTFVDSKSVIELKDRENGKIVGKGITHFSAGMVIFPCRFTMSIDAKENRYRTTFSDLTMLYGHTGELSRPVQEKKYIDQIRSNLLELDEGLSQFLASAKKDKEW